MLFARIFKKIVADLNARVRAVWVRYVMLLLTSVFLCSCATSPNALGISQSQWAQYSPEQRQQILEGYKNTQNKKTTTAKTGDSVIAVKIQGGQIMMPPFTELQPYSPLAFQIKEGQCNEKIPVTDANNAQKKTNLIVCYKDYTLFLDPSPYDPDAADGSLQFQYMPVWKRGFTYPKVTSTGYVKLTNVNISVQEIVSGDK